MSRRQIKQVWFGGASTGKLSAMEPTQHTVVFVGGGPLDGQVSRVKQLLPEVGEPVKWANPPRLGAWVYRLDATPKDDGRWTYRYVGLLDPLKKRKGTE